MGGFKLKSNKVFRIVLLFVSLIVFLRGCYTIDFNVALIGILLLWFHNIWFCIEDIEKRILLLFFHLAQFFFLIARPVISAVRGEVWWKYWEDGEIFAIKAVFISMLCFYVGAVISSFFINQSSDKNISKKVHFKRVACFEQAHHQYLQFISICGFFTAWLCNISMGIEKVLYMRGRSYSEYYVSYSSNLPYFLIVAASMMPYFLCIFLAMKPSKKLSFTVLSMNILSSLPSLLVGIRNPFVLSCVFAFLYYFIRDVFDDREKWIGRLEKLMVIVSVPVAVIFLGVYTQVRNGKGVGFGQIGKMVMDFFYGQGVSYDVLAIGYGAIPYLPERTFRNYTFGGFIDYVTRGSVAQKFFGAVGLTDGNSLINALESNNFAHNMSYIATGKEAYLNGYGLGSSYLLETFTDFGYIGLGIFSVLLGMALVYAMIWLKKGVLIFTIILVALTNIFFVPRAEALGWLQFLIYIQFWIPVFCCFIGAAILKRIKDSRGKL